MKRIILFFISLICSVFLNGSFVYANQIQNEFDNNEQNEYQSNDLTSENNNKTKVSSSNNDDIFGDEQAFPFIAGLGKNAAH